MAVLDEIDSGLDIDALRDVADAVNGLKRPQAATVMVTHYKVCAPCHALLKTLDPGFTTGVPVAGIAGH